MELSVNVLTPEVVRAELADIVKLANRSKMSDSGIRSLAKLIVQGVDTADIVDAIERLARIAPTVLTDAGYTARSLKGQTVQWGPNPSNQEDGYPVYDALFTGGKGASNDAKKSLAVSCGVRFKS